MIDRRGFIITSLAALTQVRCGASGRFGAPERDHEHQLKEIERRVGGRLGVEALDTGTGERLAHRTDERFPMCSTFKWLLVARVLARVDAGEDRMERSVSYGPGNLLEYAPVTRDHLRDGSMTVSALCAAAIEYSDNTAANLLLNTVGGPPGLTAWLRDIGDDVTRLDRIEPELNSALPGDPRDTTTPRAMATDMRRLLHDRTLTDGSRRQLIEWLMGNTTGGARLRAGLPGGWRVGDKTGTGANGSTNDVAIIWPPGKPALLVAAYLTGSSASASVRNEALADIGRLVADWAKPGRHAPTI